MNHKAILYGVLIAGGAYLVYRFVNRGQSGAWSVAPQSKPNLSSQPGQQYPYIPNQPPRVDNSNQPWYGGSRAGIAANGPQNDLGNIASYTSSIADIINSSKSIWNDLGVSDWFSDDEPTGVYDA